MTWIDMVLKICGGIAIVGSAGAIIWKIIYPAFKINSRVSELERKSKADFDLLKKLDEATKVQNRMLFAILNHMIDGNGIDKMRSTRDELQAIVTK